MSTRTSDTHARGGRYAIVPPVLLALATSACGSAPARDAARIACATAAGEDMADNCMVERGKGGRIIIHHADGGFRRLRILTDGHGVTNADGAEPAKVAITGDRQIDVSIGNDRYRLPATIAGPAPSRTH